MNSVYIDERKHGVKYEDRQDRDTYTDNEVAFLKSYAKDSIWADEESWVNAHKMPRQYINDVLETYLGVSIEEVTIPEEWTYFEETDAYYYIRSDAYGVTGHTVTEVKTCDDGTVQVFRTVSLQINTMTGEFMESPEIMLTLREKEDGGYLVLSNMVVEPEPGPLSDDELAEFTNLLTWRNDEETMWFNYAIKSIYEDVADIDLFELFYSAPLEELTQADKDYLTGIGENPDADPMVHKYSIAVMDDVLRRYFGISFEECNGVGLEKMIYNPEGECYYHRHGDFVSGYLTVTGANGWRTVPSRSITPILC